MKKIILLTGLCIFMLSCSKEKHQVLLVTGGHSFDTTEFFNLFESMNDYQFTKMQQPEANIFLGSKEAGNFKVIVFYDMWKNITEEQKENYRKITDKGTGILFLHHSLVSYQEWDEFRNILGGKYIQEDTIGDPSTFSGYKHDIELEVNILDPGHPVTSGVKNFKIIDEGYSNFIVEKNVHPLLGTKHPDSGELIGWTNKYGNSEIVYLMLGHDKKAYSNENFKKLIENSIDYLLKK